MFSWISATISSQALLIHILLDDSQNLVLLRGLTASPYNLLPLHTVGPLWHLLVAIVHNEGTTHLTIDVVELLLELEEVERCTARNEGKGPNLQLTLDAEALHG